MRGESCVLLLLVSCAPPNPAEEHAPLPVRQAPVCESARVVGADTTLSSSAEMETLFVDSTCVAFAGDLIVTGPEIRDVAALALVTEVGGLLSITSTSAADIWLPNLANEPLAVSIDYNDAAMSIELANLASVAGTLSVAGNRSATHVELRSLTTVAGSLWISRVGGTTLDGLRALEIVDGEFLNISFNDDLVSLSELAALRRVAGDLVVQQNESLPQAEVEALSAQLTALEGIGGDVVGDGNG